MIYIVTSLNIDFKKIGEHARDHALYIHKGRLFIIDIQEAIKAFLRTKNRHDTQYKVNECITIYHKKIPKLDTSKEHSVYTYEPNRNASLASTRIQKLDNIPTTPLPIKTQYGDCWIYHTFLSPERLAQVTAHRNETRLNRRHEGDSPLAT